MHSERARRGFQQEVQRLGMEALGEKYKEAEQTLRTEKDPKYPYAHLGSSKDVLEHFFQTCDGIMWEDPSPSTTYECVVLIFFSYLRNDSGIYISSRCMHLLLSTFALQLISGAIFKDHPLVDHFRNYSKDASSVH